MSNNMTNISLYGLLSTLHYHCCLHWSVRLLATLCVGTCLKPNDPAQLMGSIDSILIVPGSGPHHDSCRKLWHSQPLRGLHAVNRRSVWTAVL